VRNLIESKYFTELSEVEEEKELKISPKSLPWYPERMAWQLNLTRRDIRRVETYFKLHNFLISETESGKKIAQICAQKIELILQETLADKRP